MCTKMLRWVDMPRWPRWIDIYVFDEPSNQEFQITHSLEPRLSLFSSVFSVHRQGSDKTYTDVLNKIRVRDHT